MTYGTLVTGLPMRSAAPRGVAAAKEWKRFKWFVVLADATAKPGGGGFAMDRRRMSRTCVHLMRIFFFPGSARGFPVTYEP